MPYIPQENRPKFTPFIGELISTIKTAPTQYGEGEYFGYFVARTTKKYLQHPGYAGPHFNSSHFNEETKRILSQLSDRIAAMIDQSNPIGSAGELNYVITTTMWGLLGHAPNIPNAGYGYRAYLASMVDEVHDQLGHLVNGIVSGSTRDHVMAYRKYLIIRRVLRDVVDETYRRQTATYEDQKATENGQLWPLSEVK